MMKPLHHSASIEGWNPACGRVRATCAKENPSGGRVPPVTAWLFALFIGVLLASPIVAAAAPSPEISLSLRGVGDGSVEQGEPLRVAVRVRAPRGAKEAIKLAPASGTWADAIRVEIAPASGGAAVTLAEAVGKPDSAQATLDKTHITGGLWRVSAEAMQRLAPGNYAVRCRLTIPGGGSGWTGEVVSAATRLHVVAASNSADRVTQRAVNRAHDALLTGRVEEAASILDAVLTNSPDDGRLLTARAVVAERAGNIFAAILCAKRAERARPLTSKGLPPVELQELQTRLQLALPEAMKRSDKPAEWTWPPPSVMRMPESMMPPLTKANSPSAPALAAPDAPTPKPIPAATPGASPASAVVSAPAPASPPVVAKLPVTTAGLPSPREIVPADELNDAKVSADTAGQWAASAVAGSQYGKTQYSAAQATGAPNIKTAGNSPDAWCPASKAQGTDWLEVTFAKPVKATEVRVRQNDTVGAITKIEAIEPDGTTHVWWEGVDPYKAPAVREIVWFAVRVPKTSYLAARMKLTLNLAAGPGWKEIDAVQLVGAVE